MNILYQNPISYLTRIRKFVQSNCDPVTLHLCVTFAIRSSLYYQENTTQTRPFFDNFSVFARVLPDLMDFEAMLVLPAMRQGLNIVMS